MLGILNLVLAVSFLTSLNTLLAKVMPAQTSFFVACEEQGLAGQRGHLPCRKAYK